MGSRARIGGRAGFDPVSFELIPAIDLLAGDCVRLRQGRYDAATVYDRDPGAQAGRFAAHSIERLHVVDLDGAREGRPVNADAVRRIVAAVEAVRSLGDLYIIWVWMFFQCYAERDLLLNFF